MRGCGSVTADGLLRLPVDNLQQLFLSRSGATAVCGALYPLLERWRHSLLELDLTGGAHQPTVECGRGAAAAGGAGHGTLAAAAVPPRPVWRPGLAAGRSAGGGRLCASST